MTKSKTPIQLLYIFLKIKNINIIYNYQFKHNKQRVNQSLHVIKIFGIKVTIS